MADVPTRILKVAGTFGSYGEDGATFTPSVSEDGTLSWTNNKGLTNPNPVNVKGPTGDTGSTGPQGPQGDKGDPGVHVGSEAPTDGSNVWICPDDIPDAALPNPYKLTLTGAVEAEYDGSSPLVIPIPEGGADPRYFSITADGVISLKLSYRGVGEESYPASIGDGTEANLPEKLVIPDAVDGIKVKALSPGMFCRNTRLNEVVLPNTISEIPDYCFAYATNLRAMHNTEHITGIGVRGVSTTRIKRAIFPGLTSIEERGLGFNGYLEVVDIGNAVATLPDKVFSHCSRLREVNGGLNVKAIGQRAFLYTRKLKDLPLLANVTSIGDYAFFGSRISTSLEAGGNISDKAFPTIDNVTDFWSGVPFSACQNRIVTKLSQEAPAWKDTPVVDGDDRTTYYKGCSVFAIMHIHSAITGKYYSSPEQFVGEIKNNDNLKKYYSSYDNWTGYFEKAAEMLSDMGYNTEVYTNDLDVNSYKALVDALRAGAYVYSQIGTTGGWGNNQFDEGHVVVVYGINELGEVCVLDSAITQEPYRETGFEPDADVYTYTMPYQNLVGASSNFVIVYPPNVEPNTEDTGDYIPTPATAEIGQTIVVKAVDENGKPTEWEAADFPSGGGMPDAEEWELINSVTLTAEDAVSSIYIDKRQNGEDFEYDELCLRCDFSATSVSEGRFLINRSEPAWGQYIKIPNFFVTNTQGNQYTFFRLLSREGNFSVFQSITTRNNQNFIASKEAVLRKKMHSFYLATNANTTYMIGSYKLYGRNY